MNSETARLGTSTDNLSLLVFFFKTQIAYASGLVELGLPVAKLPIPGCESAGKVSHHGTATNSMRYT